MSLVQACAGYGRISHITSRSVMDRHDGFLRALPLRVCSQWGCLLRAVLLTWLGGLLLACSASPIHAQEFEEDGAARPIAKVDVDTDDLSLEEKLNTKGSLTLQNTNITNAMYAVSVAWGVNIVVQSDVEKSVNGVFKNAPLKQILDSLLLINGYSYRPVGDSLVIMTLEEVGVPPLFTTAVVPLRYASPEDVLPVVQILKSPRGQVQAVASSRSLLVIDFPHHVDMIKKHAYDLDSAAGRGSGQLVSGPGADRTEVGHFSLQYVRAVQLEQMVTDLLSENGRSAIIEKENQIVVADTVERLRVIGDAIKHLDRPRKQVRIAALIYDIALNDIETIGVNWSSALKGNNLDANGDPQDVFAIDSITQVPPALGAANGILTFMSMSQNFDVTAVVNALQESDDSRLLADPNVTVLDNDQASIEIVTEIPFQQLTQTSGGGQIGTTSFREAGIKLEVSPRIANDGTIEMTVTPSFSSLTGFTPEDNQPIIDRREATTTIRVADLQTIVIGGLRQRSDVGDFTGIPILKDIPAFGKLFRNRSTTVRESELVVFITPMIVPFDDCPQGRYAAALDTTNCWLHRVPWAEGCPPVDYGGFGRDGCPPALGYEGHPIHEGELIEGEIIEEPTHGLPDVEQPSPEVAPFHATSQSNAPPAQSSRRRPVPVENGRQGEPAPGEKQADAVARLKLARQEYAYPLPHPHAVSRRLPPVTPVRYEPVPRPERPRPMQEADRLPPPATRPVGAPAQPNFPPRTPVQDPGRDEQTISNPLRNQTAEVGTPRPANQLRQSFDQRYRTPRDGEGQSLIARRPPNSPPRVARNPSVSPYEAQHGLPPASHEPMPKIFESFRP
ncbi:MAG: hypothetical protein DWQ42_03060 [Planctomycetota bacterium]|nr:MAG: hypothetical protein DWQ42_03060 [Planctomycetota bacterium]REK47934.1 MAG: hypothetical protein DWQ46_03300 [Planctomycetota bacterium]